MEEILVKIIIVLIVVFCSSCTEDSPGIVNQKHQTDLIDVKKPDDMPDSISKEASFSEIETITKPENDEVRVVADTAENDTVNETVNEIVESKEIDFFVNQYSDAVKEYNKLKKSDPEKASLIAKIANNPFGHWFGSWSDPNHSALRLLMKLASSAKQVPILVVYNLPGLDCNSEHAHQGANNAEEYLNWLKAFAKELESTKCLVILEPDALSSEDCLEQKYKDERHLLLQEAIKILKSAGAIVYLDAGHSDWIPAAEMVKRLTKSGIKHADGFSLNVSNFRQTLDEIAYGKKISNLLGGNVHFVIDTSRNGAGPDKNNIWCNPPGRALGLMPTTKTNTDLLDAFLWVKVPGESDGECGGGPPAGTWWTEYAIELAKNANW